MSEAPRCFLVPPSEARLSFFPPPISRTCQGPGRSHLSRPGMTGRPTEPEQPEHHRLALQRHACAILWAGRHAPLSLPAAGAATRQATRGATVALLWNGSRPPHRLTASLPSGRTAFRPDWMDPKRQNAKAPIKRSSGSHKPVPSRRSLAESQSLSIDFSVRCDARRK